MQIVKADITDLDEIRKLNSEIMQDNTIFDPDAIEDFGQTEIGGQFFKRAIEDRDGIFLVAKEDSKILGYINGSVASFIYRKSKYFELYNLGVIPDAKRMGIGSKLMKEFTELVKKRGFNKIYLNCYAKNINALNFYKKLGYSEIDICMEKEI